MGLFEEMLARSMLSCQITKHRRDTFVQPVREDRGILVANVHRVRPGGGRVSGQGVTLILSDLIRTE